MNSQEIKELRQRLGWCTANFARYLKCSQELIIKWELGEEQPGSQYFSALQLLHAFVEANTEQSLQRILAEQLLETQGLDQITRDQIDRLTEKS